MTQQVQFNARDIQTWAGLVGDYNPIHFDGNLARERGLDGVVVHGMLSLLRLKHAISLAMDPPDAEHAWVNVKARFRNPVLRSVEHQIEVRPAGPRGRFRLTRKIDGMSAMDGTLHWTADGPEPGHPWKTFPVPQAEFEGVLNRYREGFPGMDGAWLVLDCLLFEILLQNEIPFKLSKELGLAGDCESQAELMHTTLTVQSSHFLHVRTDLVGRNLNELYQLLPLQCTVLTPTVNAPDASHGFVASCQMQLHSRQSLLIQSEVGLVVRPLPTTSKGN
ncbi:hypothetical protein D8B22_00755 [Verminephrobacter aporrectodeae subsp. tuberculatae]|uniref:MaoC/PaaZ C-terminal domain-containing protein n=1 Tax=Verminephrobacter aporrectodeae TaxID=1110389 RepID=UPI0002378516|nr:MaoC/PaaZ C-terminal domain-containing protein [Verminephrobacter aporrectodeae]MCW5257150.1 hypothetical protein [Verminephrobacter aporrectodeae subsp. tuberculatae]MCW8163578.1 hypothetical protein [Verminephrobacter aporrectodeae subsp. tuberculatae]MCW8167701.1 hypothetical protein [Verminephrobacter aporrectodeae subsp. tuberculatae]